MEHVDVLTDPWIALGIVIVCLALSAFFSGSETALTAASRARMHALETSGDNRAKIINRLLLAKERFIGAMLIGNNVVNIGASAFTTSVLIQFFGAEGTLYATIVMSILVIIFAARLIFFTAKAALKPKRIKCLAACLISPNLKSPTLWSTAPRCGQYRLINRLKILCAKC